MGKTIWIISFLISIRFFRFFNVSKILKLINKKFAIKKHDPNY